MALRFKLVFFSPRISTAGILESLFTDFPHELGKIGNYEQCAFSTPGVGQFKPNKDARPALGSTGQLEHVEEDRVEIIINSDGEREKVKEIITALKSVHPYEEVAYDVYRLEIF
ncbi:GTP cyclohydrolase 1 type 2/Nif3 [Hygrophoropsis aurantiaca]|uniref:GTP cyclohydrolase 1 type 2/Nif3 n=1 Tax=Hygrophoropsis aurantiaca TaxID=72124 RepID=A0ACB7ZXK7_9AGAM|nr:GTP cyclohydrolase 1 type 2/Nif3 [Hygrophoropsis aurantiaca]